MNQNTEAEIIRRYTSEAERDLMRHAYRRRNNLPDGTSVSDEDLFQFALTAGIVAILKP